MPNWCENQVIVTGDETDEVIKFFNESENFLNDLVPRPEDVKDWYHWNIDNWGTKWEVSREDTYITGNVVMFQSAWSPVSVGVYEELVKRFDVEVQVYYYEPGVGFAGEMWVDRDGSSDDCYEYGDSDYDRIMFEFEDRAQYLKSGNNYYFKDSLPNDGTLMLSTYIPEGYSYKDKGGMRVYKEYTDTQDANAYLVDVDADDIEDDPNKIKVLGYRKVGNRSVRVFYDNTFIVLNLW